MTTPLAQMKKAAERFLTLHAGLDCPPDRLPALLLVCAEDLVKRFGLDDVDAQDLALSAWSELSGRHTRCEISLELSSPYLVFIVDHASGRRRPIPLVDLVRMMGPRLVFDSATSAAAGPA